MITFEDWLSALTASQVGRIFWANYQYDLRTNNLDSAVHDDFTSSTERHLPGATSPVEALNETISEEPNRFDVKCSRQPITREAYSRVIEVTDFADYYLRLEELGLEQDEHIGNRVWDMLGVTITPYYYDGTMKTLRNFFWCLPSRRLDQIQITALPEQEAAVVRNQLGLYHVNKDQRLLRIDIPPDVLAGKRICAPTSLDAGINVVFAPCDDATGIGWAIDLTTLSKSVEELIIESLDFDHQYTVTKIGIVSEVVPELNLDILEANALER